MIKALGDKIPKIAESTFISQTAYVVGDVEIGEDCGVWPGAVIRGDFSYVKIGNNTHVEDNAVLHSSPSSLDIGDDVVVAHGAVVHARRIGSRVLIGMNATIMHDVEIDGFCIIAGGAVVPEGMSIPSNSFVAGVPAKVVGEVSPGQRRWIEGYPPLYELAKEYKKQGL